MIRRHTHEQRSTIHELNDVLRKDYGIDQSIEEPITARDLAILVQALKQGKVKESVLPVIQATGTPKKSRSHTDPE